MFKYIHNKTLYLGNILHFVYKHLTKLPDLVVAYFYTTPTTPQKSHAKLQNPKTNSEDPLTFLHSINS